MRWPDFLPGFHLGRQPPRFKSKRENRPGRHGLHCPARGSEAAVCSGGRARMLPMHWTCLPRLSLLSPAGHRLAAWQRSLPCVHQDSRREQLPPPPTHTLPPIPSCSFSLAPRRLELKAILGPLVSSGDPASNGPPAGGPAAGGLLRRAAAPALRRPTASRPQQATPQPQVESHQGPCPGAAPSRPRAGSREAR